MKRVKFTPADDSKLKALVNRYGIKAWQTISEFMDGKTVRQCRERYYNYLQPHIVNGEWTKDDEQLLISKVEEFGHKWAKITTFFRGRSDINVKNHWKMMTRRMENHKLANTPQQQNAQPPEGVGDTFDHSWIDDNDNEPPQNKQQSTQATHVQPTIPSVQNTPNSVNNLQPPAVSPQMPVVSNIQNMQILQHITQMQRIPNIIPMPQISSNAQQPQTIAIQPRMLTLPIVPHENQQGIQIQAFPAFTQMQQMFQLAQGNPVIQILTPQKTN